MRSKEYLENISPSEEIIDFAWDESTRRDRSDEIKTSKNPVGYVLGGQPGAGKSSLTKAILHNSQNTISIDLDNYRRWHPFFSEIQKTYGKESSRITQKFAAKILDAILQRAINKKLNIIIEGTFRTADVPLKTLKTLKDNGYKTFVCIKTCPAEVSWNRCLERYEKGLQEKRGLERYTGRDVHDLVVKNLAKNADIVFKSGLADKFGVVGDAGTLLFDSSKNNFNKLPSSAINKELNISKNKSDIER
jgi:UDP-N-acetylglucosamine kinase